MAGMEGFEPPNAGTRTQCLTTWRHPISSTNCTINVSLAQELATHRLSYLASGVFTDRAFFESVKYSRISNRK